jgi:hypothetical protein
MTLCNGMLECKLWMCVVMVALKRMGLSIANPGIVGSDTTSEGVEILKI